MPNQYSYPSEFAAQRREYNRLRSIASKRVKRLETAGLDIAALYYNTFDIPKLAYISTEEELNAAMRAVKRFLSRPTTVKEAKAQYKGLMETLNILYAPEYDPETGEGALFTSIAQVNEQARFFEYLRMKYGRTYVGKASGDAYDFFIEGMAKGAVDGIDLGREWSKYRESGKAWEEEKRQRLLDYSTGRKRGTTF